VSIPDCSYLEPSAEKQRRDYGFLACWDVKYHHHTVRDPEDDPLPNSEHKWRFGINTPETAPDTWQGVDYYHICRAKVISGVPAQDCVNE